MAKLLLGREVADALNTKLSARAGALLAGASVGAAVGAGGLEPLHPANRASARITHSTSAMIFLLFILFPP